MFENLRGTSFSLIDPVNKNNNNTKKPKVVLIMVTTTIITIILILLIMIQIRRRIAVCSTLPEAVHDAAEAETFELQNLCSGRGRLTQRTCAPKSLLTCHAR